MWQQYILIMFLSPMQAQPVPAAGEDSCVECHLSLGDELAEPVKLASQDIHFQNRLSCDSCHGGDPSMDVAEEAMSPSKGFVGIPGRKQIGALCAFCHGKIDFMRKFNPQARVDQYNEYLTSMHGKKNQEGDPNAATCIDCHNSHGIQGVSNPNSPVHATNVAATCGRCHGDSKRMASYRIATDQQELYGKSVHGEALMKQRDLSSPTCNDCHGNHGAAPPGVDSVANVCGQCHVTQWNLFNESPHQAAFADNGFPACVTCHLNHEILRPTDAMLGVEESASCVTCHDKGSAGYTAAAQMKAAIARLQDRLDVANTVLERAERAGMEVSRPLYQLTTEGRQSLVLARVQIHRFSMSVLEKTVAAGNGIAVASEQSGQKALQELAYRRRGMAVSAVILLFMIGLLLLKIRQLKA